MNFTHIEWTDETIEEFWRYWSTRPENYFTVSLGATIVRYARTKIGPLGTVLDFGSGVGGLLTALANDGVTSWGLDFGDVSVAKLKSQFADTPLVQDVISSDQLSDLTDHFDTVFLIETIEHIPDRHLEPAMRAIMQCLKPGGRLFISTPNDEDIEAAQVYCPVSQIVFHPMQHLRTWNATSLEQHLTEFGFDDAETNALDFQALGFHSRSIWMKRQLKRLLYADYKDPHLIAVCRKPGRSTGH